MTASPRLHSEPAPDAPRRFPKPMCERAGIELVYAGNCFGDRAYYLVEDTRHYPNLFMALVGATAMARKGTSRKRISRLFREAAPDWEAECTASGLSTGEGLIARVRDAEYGPNKKGETELIRKIRKDRHDTTGGRPAEHQAGILIFAHLPTTRTSI